MIASALLYAVLSSGEVDADYVPSWFCELIVDELQAGSKVELVALNGDILPVVRASCFPFAALIGGCEEEEGE